MLRMLRENLNNICPIPSPNPMEMALPAVLGHQITGVWSVFATVWTDVTHVCWVGVCVFSEIRMNQKLLHFRRSEFLIIRPPFRPCFWGLVKKTCFDQRKKSIPATGFDPVTSEL
jgi:hypothetical protein